MITMVFVYLWKILENYSWNYTHVQVLLEVLVVFFLVFLGAGSAASVASPGPSPLLLDLLLKFDFRCFSWRLHQSNT